MLVVHDRARSLPEDDIPSEIIRMLPLDGAHDKLQPNKNATPVVGSKSVNDISEELETRRINAVVCERSCLDEFDKVAQNRACVEHTVRKLKKCVDPVSDGDSSTTHDDETSEEDSSNNGGEHCGDSDKHERKESLDVKSTKEEKGCRT